MVDNIRRWALARALLSLFRLRPAGHQNLTFALFFGSQNARHAFIRARRFSNASPRR